MKRLLLIRHAKSDWSFEGIADKERCLNARGYEDAMIVAGELKEQKIVIDKFFSSHAIRAITTAMIFSRISTDDGASPEIIEKLYASDVAVYSDVIKSFDDNLYTSAIVAHNPEISQAVGYFTGKNSEELPTCSVSIIQFEIQSWKNVEMKGGKLIGQIFPRDLK
jgi:phosphohistidine phosphatase